MDRPRDNYTKWSKPDRERQISYDITYMWNLKQKQKTNNNQKKHPTIQMNLYTKQKYRSMEQDRKPRDKPTHIWSTYLW